MCCIAKLRLKKTGFIFLFFICFLTKAQTTYIENFDTSGYPKDIPNNSYWKFFNEIHPAQDTWEKFIPGDGYAYIIVDADIANDTDEVHPYQKLIFGGVGENHRLEVRMKGAAVDGGLAAFLFTYFQEGSTFNEVDIEVVADDQQTEPNEIYAPNGWTDARFNTWRNADENNDEDPSTFTGTQKPVVNENNQKISLIDGEFHTYTIDWRDDEVEFFIDGILQEAFTTNIATGWAEVNIGYRNLPWAGDFKWSGIHTMVIDYFKIEPLEPKERLSTTSAETDLLSNFLVFPNPTKDRINIRFPKSQNIQTIQLFNILSSSIRNFEITNNSFDISNLPKGVYFLKVEFENKKIVTKKIVKL